MSHTHNLSLADCLQIANSVDDYSQEQVYAAITVLSKTLKNAQEKSNAFQDLIDDEVKKSLEVASFPSNNPYQKVIEALRVIARAIGFFSTTEKILSRIAENPSILDTIQERLSDPIVE
jgi:hypothetical protein